MASLFVAIGINVLWGRATSAADLKFCATAADKVLMHAQYFDRNGWISYVCNDAKTREYESTIAKQLEEREIAEGPAVLVGKLAVRTEFLAHDLEHMRADWATAFGVMSQLQKGIKVCSPSPQPSSTAIVQPEINCKSRIDGAEVSFQHHRFRIAALTELIAVEQLEEEVATTLLCDETKGSCTTSTDFGIRPIHITDDQRHILSDLQNTLHLLHLGCRHWLSLYNRS